MIKQFIVDEFLPDVIAEQLDSTYDLLANGVAPVPVLATTAGAYSVTARYSGDANNQPSTSSAVSSSDPPGHGTVSSNPWWT